jgi:hypothetical protein
LLEYCLLNSIRCDVYLINLIMHCFFFKLHMIFKHLKLFLVRHIHCCKFSQACGVLSMVYVALIAVQVIYHVLASGLRGVAIFAIMFRSFIACFFILSQLLNSDATNAFYDEIAALIDSSSINKVVTF